MKKLTAGAVMIATIAVPLTSTFASNEREEIAEACRQAAVDETVELFDIPDFIADCLATNLATEEGEGANETEQPTESMKAASD